MGTQEEELRKAEAEEKKATVAALKQRAIELADAAEAKAIAEARAEAKSKKAIAEAEAKRALATGGTMGEGALAGDNAVMEAKKNAFETEIRNLEKSIKWGRKSYKRIVEKVDEITDDYIKSLLAERKGDFAKDLDDAIKYIQDVKGKLPLSSEITTEVMSISKQILTFGAAGLALTLGFADKISNLSNTLQKMIVIGGSFYISMVILSLILLAKYMLQARFRYPFLHFEKIGNTWPYFYYASIKPETSRSEIQRFSTRSKASIYYAEDFAKFSRKFINESKENWLRMELQQYFLLLSYQGYVNQFSLRLANIFTYGFLGSILSTVIFFVLVFIVKIL